MVGLLNSDYAEIFSYTDRNDITDVVALRKSVNELLVAATAGIPWPEGMEESTYSTNSLDGTPFKIHRFLPHSLQKGIEAGPQRAVVFAFGGGLIAGGVEVSRPVIAKLADLSQSQVFAPQYRLGPEHPTRGVEDVYSTIQWLHVNAKRLNIDPERIVLYGQSAGGGIAAGAALMARDKELSPPIAGQCLRYPMLDDRTTMDESDPRWKFLTHSVASNDIGWKCYLGGKERLERIADDISCYAAPARATNLHGLPPAHIGVGSLDLFRDEDLAYAAGLVMADVGVDFILYPGVPHGFDLNPAIDLGNTMWDKEVRWITNF
ncbi:Alpha/Beta hydrolase protein [Hypoxylon trugodes]|uniref:Alpha/Beta hydrolase protein n=1 Tax=Hypoxylon trugodes TaxID=326681 RepID=UPI00219CA79B|nr:Alpha/Beta hydrolase protein [Hypoxylon trugodes]KAI1392430.1 Alpha/Beta hydrolase protein [Hypoxylon trugodes]